MRWPAALGAATVLAMALLVTVDWRRQAAPDLDGTRDMPAFTLKDGRTIRAGRYEVTHADWALCHAEGGCSFLPRKPAGNGDWPVTGVNAWDVEAFIFWLNGRQAVQYRLPAATEWREIAGLTPREPPLRIFDDPRLAWAADYGAMPAYAKRVQPSGHFGRSGSGLNDVSGNVWEWTASCADGRILDDCPSHIAEGEHEALLSVLIRDPATGGCALGAPPANVGFRLVTGPLPALVERLLPDPTS